MTHTPEELAMARRIADEQWPAGRNGMMRKAAFDAALLAIQATTEAAAAFVDKDIRMFDPQSRIARDLRDRAHLKGNPHDSI